MFFFLVFLLQIYNVLPNNDDVDVTIIITTNTIIGKKVDSGEGTIIVQNRTTESIVTHGQRMMMTMTERLIKNSKHNSPSTQTQECSLQQTNENVKDNGNDTTAHGEV